MWRSLLTICLFSLAVPLGIAQAEEISVFNANITVYPDGTFRVVEDITYDFGNVDRHGIFRTLPLTHPQTSDTWYTDRVLAISDVSVTQDAALVPVQLTESGRELEVRIGDPERTITGTHHYQISYTVGGGLTYYNDESVDLYWNVTGAEWEVPIVSSTVRVYTPGSEPPAAASCYVGPAGSNTPCTSASSTASSTTFQAGQLASGEGFTIAVALNPELIARDVRTEWNLWWLWLTLGGVWLLGLLIYAYRSYTAHDPDETIVPHYEPYAEFKPMFTGVLLDGQLQSRDITAGILYLAEQGFIKIRKTERKILWLFDTSDYELDLLRDPQETETNFQRDVLNLLFGSQAATGETVALSALKNDHSKQRANRRILKQLKRDVDQDLLDRGFYETAYRDIFAKAAPAVAGLALLAVLAVVAGFASAVLLVGAGMLGFVTVVVLAISATRRTATGYTARNHLRGFKEFLSVTGQDRFKFHDAPAKNPEQFTEYLPYAVAFGVEKEWAEVFADITIPQPDWYDDGTGTGQFAAAALVSDLGSFSQSFSQSSGSSSASSGGGSSGGGAGGGGGGSW